LFGSEATIAGGIVTIATTNNDGKDDYAIVSCYSYMNGYGEIFNTTTGFSNNQSFIGNNGVVEDDVNEPTTSVSRAGAYDYNGELVATWDELIATKQVVIEGDTLIKLTTNYAKVIVPGSVKNVAMTKGPHICSCIGCEYCIDSGYMETGICACEEDSDEEWRYPIELFDEAYEDDNSRKHVVEFEDGLLTFEAGAVLMYGGSLDIILPNSITNIASDAITFNTNFTTTCLTITYNNVVYVVSDSVYIYNETINEFNSLPICETNAIIQEFGE
jgi:hypothetical protein